MSELKKIEFTTTAGGVRPAVRSAVKEQFVKARGLNLEDLVKLPNGNYGMPVAIDQESGEEVWAMVKITVGFKPEPKEGKKQAPEEVHVPNLFD